MSETARLDWSPPRRGSHAILGARRSWFSACGRFRIDRFAAGTRTYVCTAAASAASGDFRPIGRAASPRSAPQLNATIYENKTQGTTASRRFAPPRCASHRNATQLNATQRNDL